jgi:hypothetical protein
MRINADLPDLVARPRTTVGDDHCPVAALVAEAEKLIEAHNSREELIAPREGLAEKKEIHTADARLHLRLDELETLASSLPATSARGALFQICVASHWLELMSDHENSGIERRAKMLERILYSLAMFVENVIGSRREEAWREYYMPGFLLHDSEPARPEKGAPASLQLHGADLAQMP